MSITGKDVRPSVGLLTTEGAPLAGRVVRELLNLGVPVDAVIVDQKGMREKDLEIHHQRTSGRLPPLPLESFSDAIPFHHVSDHNADETVSLINELGLDLLVNSETPRILRKPILNATSIGILNCHPGLLPEFRGCTCVEWALYYERPVGNTVHTMVEGIDEGPIVTREETNLDGSRDYSDVRVKVFSAGVRLLAQAAADIHFGFLDPAGFTQQGEGQYRDVIDNDKLEMVEDKLAAGRYSFQKKNSGQC